MTPISERMRLIPFMSPGLMSVALTVPNGGMPPYGPPHGASRGSRVVVVLANAFSSAATGVALNAASAAAPLRKFLRFISPLPRSFRLGALEALGAVPPARRRLEHFRERFGRVRLSPELDEEIAELFACGKQRAGCDGVLVSGILEIGRRAQLRDRLLVLLLRSRDPAAERPALHFHLR